MPRRDGKTLLEQAERSLPARRASDSDEEHAERVRRYLGRYSHGELARMLGAALGRLVRDRLG